MFTYRSMCPALIYLVHCPEFMDVLSHFLPYVLKLRWQRSLRKIQFHTQKCQPEESNQQPSNC